MQSSEHSNISTTPTAAPSTSDTSKIANTPRNIIHATNNQPSHPTSAHAEQPTVDIEHVPVRDDPRKWSKRRKSFTLAIVAMAALIATLGVNIYNLFERNDELGEFSTITLLYAQRLLTALSTSCQAAINDIKAQLHATDQQISLTLSIFIVVQGVTPLFWSALSEIRGRKIVYLFSASLYLLGCGVAGSAKSIDVLIAMRVLQGIGGSAVLNIGAATLADIYEPKERGTVVGIYYAAPLLGPSLGPLIGGVATQLFSWRATFFFLMIFVLISLVTFVFFKDTFRRERSLFYQSALRRVTKEREERLRVTEEKASGGRPKDEELDRVVQNGAPDLEAHSHPTLADINMSIRDVNPILPLGSVLRRFNNITILLPSGLLFGFTYCTTYTAVRTFAAAPYFYNSLDIGLVLLSFGIGSMGGSVIGGRWSDYILRKLKAKNGKSSSEDRLQSTKPMMFVLPLSVLAYAWMAHQKVHIAGICAALFVVGFSSIWIYSSTLAYIVDANVGRSSTAVAANSLFRGLAAFVSAEVAVPLQNALGDGGLYTLWAGLMVFMALFIFLTIQKGGHWRELADEREERHRQKS